MATFTAITHRSLFNSWVLTLKELRNPNTFCQQCYETCPYQSAHFPELSLTLISSRFQVKPATLKPATLLIPNIILSFLVEEFYSTRYQSGSFSFKNLLIKLINEGGGSHCMRSFLLCNVLCAFTAPRSEKMESVSAGGPDLQVLVNVSLLV